MFLEDSIHKTSSKAWGRPTTFLAMLVEEMLLGRTKVCIGTCGGHEFFISNMFLPQEIMAALVEAALVEAALEAAAICLVVSDERRQNRYICIRDE